MVHGLAAAGLDHGNQRIADAWCKLQLLTKWEQLTHEAFPLSMPFADIFAVHQEEYEAYVKRQFAKSTPHPKCLVLDGNQKLTRRTCAEQLVDLQSIPGTPYFFLQDCNRTPRRKSAFCSRHARPLASNCGVRVCKKDCVGDSSASLLKTVPSTGVVDWPLPEWLRNQVHRQSAEKQMPAGDADVSMAADFVSCRTIKMKKRVNRRSGGWLVACDEQGFIMGAMEFLGGESLTQRAALVSRMIGEYPTVATVIHDDACHLRLFMDRWFPLCPHLRYPQVGFVIDKFHSASHTDTFCRQNCSPKTAENSARLQGVNTSACEILFQWLSGFKASFRHMNRLTAQFFVPELLLMRNEWRSQQQTRKRKH